MNILPEKLTIAMIEKRLGPASEWHGQCFGVATVAADLLGEPAVAVYGHYLGYVDADGYWKKRADNPFIQHGWVLLGDGRVLDPTRFSFENCKPYVYISPVNPEEYDEGGNQWREATFAVRPPPSRNFRGYGAADTSQPIKMFAMKLGPALAHSIATMIGPSEVDVIGGSLFVTKDQIFWLANAPYDTFGSNVFKVYEQICLTYGGAAIPIDNRRRAEREAKRELPEKP